MFQSSRLAACVLSVLGGAASASGQCLPATYKIQSEPTPSKLGISMARDGTTLVVGSPEPSLGLVARVNVYEQDRLGAWVLATTLVQPYDPFQHAATAFGMSVAIEGNTLVVGSPAPAYLPAGTWVGGLAFIYERGSIGSAWQLAATLAIGGEGQFGYQVEVDAGIVVVAAPTSYGYGEISVYEKAYGEWRETTRFAPPDSEYGIGASLDFENGTLVTGIRHGFDNLAGGIGFYERQVDGSWTEQYYGADTFNGLDQETVSVALSGDRAVAVGQKGWAFLYERSSDGWSYVSNQYVGGLSERNTSLLEGDQLYIGLDQSTRHYRFGEGSWNLVEEFVGIDAAFLTLPSGYIGATEGTLFHLRDQAGTGASPAKSYCSSGTTPAGCSPVTTICGTPSASATSGLSVTVSGVEANHRARFYYGLGKRSFTPWNAGTSFLCIGTPNFTMKGWKPTVGPTLDPCGGSMELDALAFWTEKPALNPGAGATVRLQALVDSPSILGGPNAQVGVWTNALVFTLLP